MFFRFREDCEEDSLAFASRSDWAVACWICWSPSSSPWSPETEPRHVICANNRCGGGGKVSSLCGNRSRQARLHSRIHDAKESLCRRHDLLCLARMLGIASGFEAASVDFRRSGQVSQPPRGQGPSNIWSPEELRNGEDCMGSR